MNKLFLYTHIMYFLFLIVICVLVYILNGLMLSKVIQTLVLPVEQRSYGGAVVVDDRLIGCRRHVMCMRNAVLSAYIVTCTTFIDGL